MTISNCNTLDKEWIEKIQPARHIPSDSPTSKLLKRILYRTGVTNAEQYNLKFDQLYTSMNKGVDASINNQQNSKKLDNHVLHLIILR
jgi:hypothetical protein